MRSQDCFWANWGEGGNPFKGSWRANKATQGGGELIDTGYHPTYRLMYLAAAKPAAASATYMGNLTSAFIKAGGATFDVPTGRNITITQALLTVEPDAPPLPPEVVAAAERSTAVVALEVSSVASGP